MPILSLLCSLPTAPRAALVSSAGRLTDLAGTISLNSDNRVTQSINQSINQSIRRIYQKPTKGIDCKDDLKLFMVKLSFLL